MIVPAYTSLNTHRNESVDNSPGIGTIKYTTTRNTAKDDGKSKKTNPSNWPRQRQGLTRIHNKLIAPGADLELYTTTGC